MAFDQAKFEAFLNKSVGDLGAAMSAALVVLGDRLGLYRALVDGGAQTPAELAERTGCKERYVHEWCCAQAAGGILEYDAASGRFTLPPEHAFALADPDSPVFLPGGFQVAMAAMRAEATIADRFRNGGGLGWHEHHADLFHGTERFFRASYIGSLVSAWIPALDGVQPKLERGGRVADIGCGHGASTILMAQSFPRSEFIGFDYHEASIEHARRKAEKAGVGNARFEAVSAKELRGEGFDLVTFFDCLHDMGDPVGAARHAHEVLAPDGTAMLVEPFAGDRIEDNLNPVGRVFYSASTLICTPCSLSQEQGLGLGALAGETRLTGILKEAGFSRVRRATETPFNLILEARA
jgi:2-polyprenyl-3-methyl-5-hydroxy-6-metoxy-1,4-benzoquinol methylase